jgi:diacylglycerol kinase (ATP)
VIHAALAVNPACGRRTAAGIAGIVAARLRDGVDRLELVAGRTAAEFQALISCHVAELDVLVVLGGDGTVHQAVQSCAGTGTALGLLPAGSGNDFARALGVPLDPLAALDFLLTSLHEGRRRRIDLGWTGQEWFASVLCAGFDASAGQRAGRWSWPNGPLRYDLAALAEIISWRPRRLSVRTETGSFELDAMLVAVGNTAYYGGGIPICPAACPEDGLFDVTVLGKVSRGDLVRILPRLRTGRTFRHPAVHSFQAREIHLSAQAFPCLADGEVLDPLPISAQCVPGALTVLA